MPGRRSKRSAAAAAIDKIKKEEDEDIVEEEEEEEVVVKKKPKRGAKKNNGKAAVKKEDDDEMPLKKKRGKKNGKAPAMEEEDEEEEEEEEEEAPKMKSVVLKGAAPVDEHCPVKDKCMVFQEDDVVWDCMLNQTNIKNNNNKFYLIQLLKEDSQRKYYVWMRWGRVGYTGQTSLTPCGGELDGAKSTFESKFRDKTRNDWADGRDAFEKVPGKYDLVAMDYSVDDTDSKEKKKGEKEKSKKPPAKIPDSKLDQAVQELVRLICDVDTMEQTMVEMQYDTKKAPLGKITSQQIKAGYEALKRISDLISSPKSGSGRANDELFQACNDFYTRIPHEFGMKQPPLIRTNQEVKRKIELLEALGDIQVAMKILSTAAEEEEELHPVDRQYRQLDCSLTHLEPDSKDFELVSEYITSTHGRTHTMYRMKVERVFQCGRDAEEGRFKDLGNRVLLFHGSRMSNWAGILGQGLRIAPPEAPSTGYMFGKGIYFADMASKSANYCWPSPSKNVGFLLLCEVALGKQNELLQANCNADRLPKAKHSVKGCGQTGPDFTKARKLSDGTLVPMGPPVDTGVAAGAGGAFTLAYNEYIVYDPAQVKMRYLAKIKFDFSS